MHIFGSRGDGSGPEALVTHSRGEFQASWLLLGLWERLGSEQWERRSHYDSLHPCISATERKEVNNNFWKKESVYLIQRYINFICIYLLKKLQFK